jgi:hypothetical protein
MTRAYRCADLSEHPPYASLVSSTPTDPGEVWQLVTRADDLVKYSANRDPAVARKQARKVLDEAARAAAALPDRQAGEALAEQVRTRIEDLDRQEG